MKINNSFLMVGFSEFFSKILSWLSLAIIPLFASPTIYGEIVLYYSIIMFFVPVFLFGQDRLILRQDETQELLNSFVFTSCIWLLFSFLLFLLDYLWVSVAALILTFNKIYLTYLRASERLKIFAINRFIYSISRFLLVIIAVYFFYSLKSYIFAEILAALLATSLVCRILFSSGYIINIDYFERFKHGLPLMLHGVSLFGIALVDRFVLEKYSNFTVVGNYSFIYIFSSGLIFLYSIISIFQEKKIYKSESNEELISYSRQTLLQMFIIGILGAACSLLLYYSLIRFNIVKGYGFYLNELILLILAHLVLPIYLVSNYILIQKGRSKYLLGCSVFALIINIIINFMLIPDYGLIGAVWSTLISNILLVILSATLSISVVNSKKLL